MRPLIVSLTEKESCTFFFGRFLCLLPVVNHLLWDRELDSCRRAFHHATSPASAPSSSSSFMATSSWSSFLTKVWRLSLQMVPYTFMNDLWPNMMKIYMREACIWLLSGYDHWHCHYHNHRHFILPPKWITFYSGKWIYQYKKRCHLNSKRVPKCKMAQNHFLISDFWFLRCFF